MRGCRIIHGDALQELSRIQDSGVLFDLIYVDPPFNTGKAFKTKKGEPAFSDKFETPIDYMNFLYSLAVQCKPLLEAGGSFVLHLDPTWSHAAKYLLDGVLGTKNFASEIVWRYRRWPVKSRNFQRMHDVLLRWVKPGAPPIFNQLYEPLAPSTIAVWGDKKKQKAYALDGKRRRSVLTDQKSEGALLSDVWELPILAPVAKERNGYPTQKPEELLERLVLALSGPGGAVLDPCCGSGTTLAAALKHGRLACGIDKSPVAIRYARKRLGLTR